MPVRGVANAVQCSAVQCSAVKCMDNPLSRSPPTHLPPTMNVNVPASAPPTPPDTGASTMRICDDSVVPTAQHSTAQHSTAQQGGGHTNEHAKQ